jgi:hypothetical protein
MLVIVSTNCSETKSRFYLVSIFHNGLGGVDYPLYYV